MNLGTKLGLMIVGVLLLILLSAPTAMGYGGEPTKSIILVPEGDYEVGSTVNIETHLFEKAVYKNADDINVTIGSWPNQRHIDAVASGTTGIYDVDFTIQANDTYNGYVSVRIETTIGNLTAVEYINIQVEHDVDIDVMVEVLSGMVQGKNDTFEAQVTVKKDGTLTDASDIEGYVEGDTYWQDINGTWQSTGTYLFEWTAPANLTNLGSFQFGVDVNVTDDWGYGWTEFTVREIEAWIHKANITTSNAGIKIYVVDKDGKPVSGATVDVTHDHDGNYSTLAILTSKTTNADGVATFDLNHDDLATITGMILITSGGLYHTIDLHVDLKNVPDTMEDPEPWGSWFQVEAYDEDLKKGSNTVDFIAFNNSASFNNTDIYYYFTQAGSPTHTIIKYGKATTDGEGKFSVTFSVATAKGMVYGYFHAATGIAGTYDDSNDGLTYDSDTAYFWFDHEAEKSSKISISTSGTKIEIGKALALNVKVPTQGMLFVVMVPQGVSLDDINTIGADILWQLILPDPIYVEMGTSTVTVMLPSFLPNNAKFIFFAMSWDDDGQYYNFLEIKPGQSGGTGGGGGDGDDDDDDDGGIPGFEALFFVAAIGISLAAIEYRRR